jgi:hypothetical protein
MEDCQERIYKAKATMPKEVNYAEKITTLKEAIAGMKNPDYTPEQKNRLLKAIINRIELITEHKGHNAVDIHLAVFLRL